MSQPPVSDGLVVDPADVMLDVVAERLRFWIFSNRSAPVASLHWRDAVAFALTGLPPGEGRRRILAEVAVAVPVVADLDRSLEPVIRARVAAYLDEPRGPAAALRRLFSCLRLSPGSWSRALRSPGADR